MNTLAALPAALVLGGLIALTPGSTFAEAPAGPAETSGQRTVSVEGKGTATLMPDVAEIALRVRARAKTLDAALQQYLDQRALFARVAEDFRDLELEEEGLGVRLGLQNQDSNVVRFNGQEPAAPPFEAKETIELRMAMGQDRAESLKAIAELVAAMGEVDCELDAPDPDAFRYRSFNGQEVVGPIRFLVSDEAHEAARRVALVGAFRDARIQAEQLAAAAGASVGRVLKLETLKGLGQKANTSQGRTSEVSLRVAFELLD